jgi:hypothetical protein
MNDLLARELVDVLQDISATQRVIEKHLAEIRFNIHDFGMRDDLTKFQCMKSTWNQQHDQIAQDRLDEGL